MDRRYWSVPQWRMEIWKPCREVINVGGIEPRSLLRGHPPPMWTVDITSNVISGARWPFVLLRAAANVYTRGA